MYVPFNVGVLNAPLGPAPRNFLLLLSAPDLCNIWMGLLSHNHPALLTLCIAAMHCHLFAVPTIGCRAAPPISWCSL
jgi:hypothetical protein